MKKRKVKVANIVGTRPNFIKIFPVIREMDNAGCFEHTLIHTGQHHDSNMSDIFFKEFSIKEPDIQIVSGGGSHSEQTGKIMAGLETVFMKIKPDLVLVVGDVNSTLAATLAASKLLIPVAHVEAGLRSFDRTMPEEINRIVTDRFSKYLFVTSADAIENLKREGIKGKNVFFTGNVMIDTLLFLKKGIIKENKILTALSLEKKKYCYLTLHRPSNVDSKEHLKKITGTISKISKDITVVFPIHPRTKKMLHTFGLEKFLSEPNIVFTGPLGYNDSINLTINSRFVITDSGGLQEETTALGVPCITLRENTERPVTVTAGTNTITGSNTKKLISAYNSIMNGTYKKGRMPKYWDGKAAKRIVKILKEKLYLHQ